MTEEDAGPAIVASAEEFLHTRLEPGPENACCEALCQFSPITEHRFEGIALASH